MPIELESITIAQAKELIRNRLLSVGLDFRQVEEFYGGTWLTGLFKPAECQSARTAYLNGENPPTMVFGRTRQKQVFATHFHSEADHIVTWLTTQPKRVWEPVSQNPDSLWQLVHDRFIAEFLGSAAAEGKIEEAIAFAERMRTFCNQLIQLRERTKKFQLVAGRVSR
jgi:hypothetical protein